MSNEPVVPTERPDVPGTADERELLRVFLDFHRSTLAMKCAGLDDAQLRSQASPPSTLSLLGLVRHMAEVERTWFRRVFAGEADLPLVFSPDGDFQAAYDARAATRDEAFAAWEAEVAAARRIERAAASLDETVWVPRWQTHASLRMLLLHMIHEYARHNGHADLIREGIDGTVGA